MSSSREIAVLLYHHVGPVIESQCRGLTVTPAAFSRQIATLSALGWTTIAPDDWAGHVHGECDIPPRSVIITFDDAYADLVEHALPVLEKRSFLSTVFVPTALIGQSIQCHPQHAGAMLPIMSEEQIVEWSERGVSFGAHSRTHVDLTELSPADLTDEIIGSRDDLAALTGRAIRSFAYPYGRVDRRVHDIVARCFSVAFTIEEGVNDIRTPLASLRRTMVQHGDSVADVCLRARYGKSVLQNLRGALGGAAPRKPAEA
jgi:peptidoglycan/xylan/chitin deacetylase (PgdA/CDA1 family)